MTAPPTYRDRLRLEGTVLAASGAVASVALIAAVPEARRWPLNTAGQLAVVTVLLAVFGPRALRSWTGAAHEVTDLDGVGSGEPTPLWHGPTLVALLALAVSEPPFAPGALGERAGWDAGLRVTGGAALVGLAQVALSRRLAARERSEGRRYFRAAGSRILRGTKLVAVREART